MGIADRHLIVNPLAPVRAYKRENLDETRDFPNLAAFEAWYHPGHHGAIQRGGFGSQIFYTDFLLDRLDDAGRRHTVVRGDGTRGVERAGGERPRAGRHQKVEVNGIVYNSAWAAFQKLDLGDAKECVKFRTQLKAAGSGIYRGRQFKIVEG